MEKELNFTSTIHTHDTVEEVNCWTIKEFLEEKNNIKKHFQCIGS